MPRCGAVSVFTFCPSAGGLDAGGGVWDAPTGWIGLRWGPSPEDCTVALVALDILLIELPIACTARSGVRLTTAPPVPYSGACASTSPS